MDNSFNITKGAILAIIGVVVLLGLFARGTPGETNRLRMRIGMEALEIVQNPDEVVNAADGKRLSQDHADELQELLLTDSSYTFDKQKRCPFMSESAFQFIRGKEVTVEIGLACAKVRFTFNDQVETIDCDPVAERLKNLLWVIAPEEPSPKESSPEGSSSE